VARNARDGVLDLRVLLAVTSRDADQATHLGRARPIESSRQAVGDLQSTMDEATVLFAAGFSYIKMRDASGFGRRGKKPPGTRRRWPP
jgi:hypothetical protein